MGARHSSEFKRPVSSDGMSPKMSAALKRLDSKPKPLRRRAHSFSFDSNDEPWGWFEDFETSKRYNESSEESKLEQHLQRALSLPAPATSPPIYVLESSLATQHLWYETAGRRPKQPQHEREYFERLWLKNFEVSSVQYEAPSSNTLARLEKIPKSECDGEILFRGKGPFSNSVSKSFSGHDISSLTLQVHCTSSRTPYFLFSPSCCPFHQLPSFRIVRLPNGELHADFLVVVSIASQYTLTFGVWKRHSHFHDLVETVCFL